LAEGDAERLAQFTIAAELARAFRVRVWQITSKERGPRGDHRSRKVLVLAILLNWVRLANRFPVRILLEDRDAGHPFHMGTTAVVTIRRFPSGGAQDAPACRE
jgi:hypothetical protein